MNNSTAKAKPKMTDKKDVDYGDNIYAKKKKRIVMQQKKDRKAKKIRKSAQQTMWAPIWRWNPRIISRPATAATATAS